jgi:hypothetical protein
VGFRSVFVFVVWLKLKFMSDCLVFWSGVWVVDADG